MDAFGFVSDIYEVRSHQLNGDSDQWNMADYQICQGQSCQWVTNDISNDISNTQFVISPQGHDVIMPHGAK